MEILKVNKVLMLLLLIFLSLVGFIDYMQGGLIPNLSGRYTMWVFILTGIYIVILLFGTLSLVNQTLKYNLRKSQFYISVMLMSIPQILLVLIFKDVAGVIFILGLIPQLMTLVSIYKRIK